MATAAGTEAGFGTRRGGSRPGPRPHKRLDQRTAIRGALCFRIAYEVALTLQSLLRRPYPSYSLPARPNPDALLGLLITEAVARNGSSGGGGRGLLYPSGHYLRFENVSPAAVQIDRLIVPSGGAVEIILTRPWHESEGAGAGGPWGFAGYTTATLLAIGRVAPEL